ncbi:alpha/beta fold hydrolase [Burkholderia gladioli]|uniref:alpha/beta fold hydrolase n=1 Tax=Burkholderia gladioli TaxID=28095 RepID=UPI000BBD1D29|nr:alpha/beta hydrolase [Burkholderia gladioli]ATF88429.1 alpha/beta hydrolase [Burkholderia gladioli pv. gladioli]MBJ9716062.1 alpha/beta hydrolase [Burkholderia gladioli]MBU9156528.1 alpha/beta hydrolase [Burkholderia gladioli]MCH7274837.1 alpha/beta hydrolase [Burkholderia gladioli]MDR8086754.1 alpha/beta hydrolase [Burkholderia gladioli]
MIAQLIAIVVAIYVVLFGFTQFTAYQVRRRFPPEGKFVDIDGDRLHYVDYGSGPPIVMVHGLCGQLRNFAYLELPRLAQSHRVIVVDRAGSGRSTRGPASQANVYAQARTIARFIDTLGLEKPLLVGHSLGGAIALAVGLDHPDSVSRIALIAPLTHTETEPPAAFKGLALRWPLLRRFASLTMGIPVMILQSRKAIDAIFAPEPVPRDFPIKGGGLMGLRPDAFYAASSDLVAAPEDLPEMERRYPTLGMPVSVLYGRQDAILSYRKHGEALKQKLPGIELTLVEGGHMLPVTQPVQTTDWIREVAAQAAEPAAPVARAAAGR